MVTVSEEKKLLNTGLNQRVPHSRTVQETMTRVVWVMKTFVHFYHHTWSTQFLNTAEEGPGFCSSSGFCDGTQFCPTGQTCVSWLWWWLALFFKSESMTSFVSTNRISDLARRSRLIARRKWWRISLIRARMTMIVAARRRRRRKGRRRRRRRKARKESNPRHGLVHGWLGHRNQDIGHPPGPLEHLGH